VEYHLQGSPFCFLAPHILLSRPNRLFRAAIAFSLSVSLADLVGVAGFDGLGRSAGGGLRTAGKPMLTRLTTLGGVDLVGRSEVGGLGYGTVDRFGFRGGVDLVGRGEVGGLGYGTVDRFGFRGGACPLVLADISLRFSCVVSRSLVIQYTKKD